MYEFRFTVSALLSLTLFWAAGPVSDAEGAAQAIRPPAKAVLVTGASSGLGRAMTELLAARGFFVYAGARSAEDIDALNAIENVQAVRLDVTVQADIDAAVRTISEAGRGLFGLINNAGVAVVGPMIELDEGDFDFQFDVNVKGPYRVTKAFAPLLIEAQGRIATTGSIAGINSRPLMGAYSMSKHAIEAYTDSLAAEMSRFGVHVSVIEPGIYRTSIAQNTLKRMAAGKPQIGASLFQQDLQEMIDFVSGSQPAGGDPLEVAEAALHAMSSETPKRRYMVVPVEAQAEYTIEKAMRELVQLNHAQPFSFDREKLIGILDRELADIGKSARVAGERVAQHVTECRCRN